MSYIKPDPLTLILPKCAICGTEVKSIKKDYNYLMAEVVYTVECHGDRETMSLTDYEMMEAHSIEPGIAFSTKRLENRNDYGLQDNPTEPLKLCSN